MRFAQAALAAMALFLAAPLLAYSEEIAASVGKDGENKPDDVLIVQVHLNQVPKDIGGPEEMLVPDGLCGPKTIAAIERFQKQHLGEASADGRVAPGKETIKRLNETVDAQPLAERIVNVAKGERLFWKDGQRKELDEVVSTRLQKYWKAVGLNYTVEQLRDAKFHADNPWSAAFVSWVMKTAGAGDNFRYAASHWRYVAAAKENRNAGNDNPLKAYRPNEKEVEPGDVVVKRRGNSRATYENVQTGHITHGDIVVAVANGKAETIGGNVSNSVKTTTVELDENSNVAAEGYFAVVKVK